MWRGRSSHHTSIRMFCSNTVFVLPHNPLILWMTYMCALNAYGSRTTWLVREWFEVFSMMFDPFRFLLSSARDLNNDVIGRNYPCVVHVIADFATIRSCVWVSITQKLTKLLIMLKRLPRWSRPIATIIRLRKKPAKCRYKTNSSALYQSTMPGLRRKRPSGTGVRELIFRNTAPNAWR